MKLLLVALQTIVAAVFIANASVAQDDYSDMVND